MIVRGTWDWNLIKIETDSGLYGIGEAYWGWGVKDLVVNKLRPIVQGEDPLNVDKLYTKMLMESAGAGAIAGVTVTAVSGIEIALWDLAGRILQTPACNLLGGRFRDRVRFYRTMPAVERPEDPQAWRDQVREARAEKFGWTAFKFQGDGIPPKADPGVQRAGSRPLHPRAHAEGSAAHRQRDGDRARGAGPGHRFRRRGALEVRRARCHPDGQGDRAGQADVARGSGAAGQPRSDGPRHAAVDIPICTGENLYTRDGFRRLIELQGCDIVHLDIPKSGGLLEAKRIHDLADNYYIATAAHNPASPVGTIASCHAAASMRDFRVHELARYIDWWQDLVIHDGPVIKDGYLTIQDKPGYGIEINPDVARAHLAPGETWWG